jgi:hypothetical protein
MKRTAAALVAVAACATTAYALTRGPSGGLVPIEEENAGFELHCGDTANWQAATVANTSKTSVVIQAVHLDAPPRAFSLAYARGWFGSRNTVADDGRAHTPLKGLRVAYTRPWPAPAWHLLVGIRMPPCRSVRGSTWWLHATRSIVVSYTIGHDHRTVRLGADTTICAAPRRHRCHTRARS